jgi:Fe-S-cluster-containing hydrogenase component 2
MAYYIVAEECIACGDCMPVCPTNSVKEGRRVFEINTATCNECSDDYDQPQCTQACPIEHCILRA